MSQQGQLIRLKSADRDGEPTSRRLRAPVQLVRLPRGRVRVVIVARTSTGRTVAHTRRYRTGTR